MTWRDLFDRAEAFETNLETVHEKVAERRNE